MPESKEKHIEDTIYDESLPVNPNPVIHRLQELINEAQTNDPAELRKDLRIQKTLWLLMFQFYGTLSPFIKMYDWFKHIEKQEK